MRARVCTEPTLTQTRARARPPGDACRTGQGMSLRVRSAGLPLGAGLGSSAALSVATAAAMLRLRYAGGGALDDCVPPGMDRPPEPWLQCINQWAYAAEVVTTGHPSGIDNTVCCFGAAVECRKGPAGTMVNRVSGFPALRLLVTNTMVKKTSTASLVAGVRELRASSAAMGRAVNSVFQSMEAITDEFLGQFSASAEGDHHPGKPMTPAADARLQELVRMNHALLNSIGVGHASLDEVCRITRAHGVETKLTGAGAG